MESLKARFEMCLFKISFDYQIAIESASGLLAILTNQNWCCLPSNNHVHSSPDAIEHGRKLPESHPQRHDGCRHTGAPPPHGARSEEHTSELQSQSNLV